VNLVEGDFNSSDSTITTAPGAGSGEPRAAAHFAEVDGSTAPDSTEIPRSLYARFENFKFLGRGGMGAVYQARDHRLGRDVAVKLLFGADPSGGGGSLMREAQSQARLTHENACKVYEAGVIDNVRFLVMQLIDGKPLDQLKDRLTLDEKVRVIRQIASALHEAHRLGLVHRDVKPSNIMVERGEGGDWKPYLMDFGLAREIGDSGLTVTGAILGTPAFMSPEQAAGKIRSLGRRSDVYSLGATLYNVLAGRPPFIGLSMLDTLRMVMEQDAAPIRSVNPDIPRDLDAIAMKCLEKAPDARYESAKALGEDLQRFLDGDPVMARRASLGYVLLKRAKRNKAAVAALFAALCAVGVVTGMSLRSRRIAAEQATLSRELGESVKEMELFLRSAHGMPLHDIERERDIVRSRLGEITRRMEVAGPIGQGPGQYALGRGYLALKEPKSAFLALKKALEAGYRSPGLDYAMGIALGELYKKELEGTKRIEDVEKRRARVAEIEVSYKAPALQHLRSALGGSIEVPEYAEGLIALYEGRNEEALAKAREAFAKAPWLYEAKKLEGDVLFAIGSLYRPDAAFDYDVMMKWFGQAAEAYRIAADFGRSDSAVYEAECELWTQVMNAAPLRGESMRPSFEKARSACGKAIASSSKSGAGNVKLASSHHLFAWWVVTGEHPDEDPEEAIKEAVLRAEEAAKKSPDDPMARYLVGAMWRTRGMYALDRGLDMAQATERAVAGYEDAIRLDAGFLWALYELCSSLSLRGVQETFSGSDPSASMQAAVEQCDRAIALDPKFMPPKFGKIMAYTWWADYLVSTGRSPAEAVRLALVAIESVKEQSPNWHYTLPWLSRVHCLESTYALDAGRDAAALLERAEASVKELEQRMPSSAIAHGLRGHVEAIKARSLLAREEDPLPSLSNARAAVRLAVEAKPWDIEYRLYSAEVEITAMRAARKKGRADAALFDAGLALFAPLLNLERADPRLYQNLSEIHALRAAWLTDSKKEAGEDVARGLAMAEKALSKNPRMASALASKGRLLLLQAQQASGAPARRASAQGALSALTMAVRENPLLERTEARAIEEARRLAGEEEAPVGAPRSPESDP